MEEFTGGARIGWVNASWPLAKLTVTAEELTLQARLVGTHRFKPEHVAAIAEINWLPVLASGVRIHHVRPDVPERVIFWNMGGPKPVLAALSRAGFTPTASSEELERIKQLGFPFRIPFVIAMVLLWNGLFALDRAWHIGPFVWGPFIISALALLFAVSLLVRREGWLQRVALKTPETLPRVRGFLNLLTIVSGVMMLIGSIVTLTQ
jgi:hypothetical protein